MYTIHACICTQWARVSVFVVLLYRDDVTIDTAPAALEIASVFAVDGRHLTPACVIVIVIIALPLLSGAITPGRRTSPTDPHRKPPISPFPGPPRLARLIAAAVASTTAPFWIQFSPRIAVVVGYGRSFLRLVHILFSSYETPRTELVINILL